MGGGGCVCHAVCAHTRSRMPNQVLEILHKGALYKIAYWKGVEHAQKDLLVLDVYKRMEPRTFTQYCHIATQGDPIDGMYQLVTGSAQVHAVTAITLNPKPHTPSA